MKKVLGIIIFSLCCVIAFLIFFLTQKRMDLNSHILDIEINTENSFKQVINRLDGYKINVGTESEVSFDGIGTYIKEFKSQTKPQAEILITYEYSPYEDVQEYINHYYNRFLLNENYRSTNNIHSFEHKTTDYTKTDDFLSIRMKNDKNTVLKSEVETISASIDGIGLYNRYTFAFIKTNTQNFYRIMFKYNDEDYKKEIDNILLSFESFNPQKLKPDIVSFKPALPSNWTEETKLLYENISTATEIKWGIFTDDMFEEGINYTVPMLEDKLDYSFGILLCYTHLQHDFPLEFMNKAYKNGKTVELTYQITTNNNVDLFVASPMLEICRGNLDDSIRNFAKGAKEFGHPFLFRLNNEMNTDWASYSGIVNLSDPDIYKAVWQRIYKIFEEEGVTNAIWIFNPNDKNFPPAKWNNFTNYYPGNEYVQMLGITGYNTGTYFEELNAEGWAEFKTIYNEIAENYRPYFSEFPWIITEFATSSIGGDKVKWINNMFNDLPLYPEIKAAVWFNSVDYDPREGFEGIISRPYRLNETEEALNAFKAGLRLNKPINP